MHSFVVENVAWGGLRNCWTVAFCSSDLFYTLSFEFIVVYLDDNIKPGGFVTYSTQNILPVATALLQLFTSHWFAKLKLGKPYRGLFPSMWSNISTIMTCVNNYTHAFIWDITTHPCLDLTGCLAKCHWRHYCSETWKMGIWYRRFCFYINRKTMQIYMGPVSI